MNTDPSLLKILLLLSFRSPNGATTASSQYYRRKNGSFCLQAAKSPPYDVSLDFGEKVVIYNNKASQAYKHRVDYDQKTLQWCLHQLSETDSGTYRLRVMKDDMVTDRSLVLVVEEAVPRPVIRTSELRSNLSAGVCNISVNCSVWEDWVSSVCNESLCQTSGRSLKTVNITVSAGYRSVICSGSNSVSTSNTSETICFNDRPGNPEEKQLQQLFYVGLLCLLALLLLALCGLLSMMVIKHQKDTRPPQQIHPSVSSRVSTFSSQSESAYENVDAAPSGQDRRVDTTYNLVEGPHGAQKAKAPGEVETVYSVLQKV